MFQNFSLKKSLALESLILFASISQNSLFINFNVFLFDVFLYFY